MLKDMNKEGIIKITDLLERVIVVKLTEEIISTALSLPKSNYHIKERRAHSNLEDIFENPKNIGNTYAHL